MPTAEWYEQQARKIKLKTWKISDRYSEFDRLNLILTDRLSKIKPLLMQYETDPVKKYSLPERDKQTISTLKKYAPSLFKKAEPYVKPKTPTQTAMAQAQTAAVRGEVSGVVEEGTLDKLIKYGIVPDMRNKNFWGRLRAGAAFPLQKLMGALMTPERTVSATDTEIARQIGAEEFKKYSFLHQPPVEKGVPVNLKETLKPKYQDLKAPTSQWKITKAMLESFINLKGSEYQDWEWSKAFKETMPEKAKSFEGGKRIQDNARRWQEVQDLYSKGSITAEEKGNRELALFREYGYRPTAMVKALGGLAGSPADIRGLVANILMPPFSMMSGGLGTGAKTGLKLTKPLIAKGGKVVLPKGAMLGLTKAGRAALKPAVVTKVDDIVKTLATVTAKEAKLMPAVSKFLPEGGMTVVAARSLFTRKILEETLEQTVKNLPYEQAVKLIDFGGLKFAGETIIPGYKFARFTKPIVAGAEKKPVVAALEKMFWTGKGVPEEFRPLKHIVEAQMRYRGTQGRALLDDIFKDLSKSEIDDVGKYLWMNSDVAILQGKGKVVPAKLLNQLDDLAKKLNPKQIAAATDYQNRFIKDYLAKFEKGLGIQYPELPKYYPSRYMTESKGLAKYDIGPTIAAFEKQKTLPYLQAQELIAAGKLKPKGVYAASLRRLYESTSRSGRELMLQEVKQFGRPFKTAGMENAGKYIKGLEGWYLPDEFIKPLTNMNKAFYGDEAVRYTMNIIDKGVSVWKKLALFTPGYHGRNFWTDLISGWMEYGLKFFNPRYWDEAIRIKLQKRVAIESLGGMFGDDAAKMLMKTGEMQAGMYAIESGRGVTKGIARWTPFQISRRAGVFREDMGRIVASLIEREAGSSTATAAEAVAKVFFDYNDITQFERHFMRRAAIPFYTWFRKNIARQAELLVTRTGRYATIPKVATFIEGMSEMPEGYQEYKPEYFADLFVTLTPFRTQEGVPLALNPNFAWQDWSRLSLRDLASNINPMLKVPIELLTKTEIFFDKPIREGEIVKAPRALQWAKKLPKDIYENFGFSIGKDNELYMTERAEYLWRQNPLFYNLGRLYPVEPNPKTPYDWLSILVGIKFFPYEEDKQKQYYFQRFSNAVDEKIGQQREMGYEMLSAGQIEKAYRQIYANAMVQKYPNVKAARHIKEMTKYSGSTKEGSLMIKLMEKPYNDEMAKIKDMSLPELHTMLLELGIKPTIEEIYTAINQLNAASQQ